MPAGHLFTALLFASSNPGRTENCVRIPALASPRAIFTASAFSSDTNAATSSAKGSFSATATHGQGIGLLSRSCLVPLRRGTSCSTAAYTAAAPRSFYDGIAATGHPVGVYLRDQQQQSLQQLWEGINEGNLPPALTPAWFFKTFTDIAPDSDAGKSAIGRATAAPQDFDSIWKQVTRFNLTPWTRGV